MENEIVISANKIVLGMERLAIRKATAGCDERPKIRITLLSVWH